MREAINLWMAKADERLASGGRGRGLGRIN